MKEIGQQGKAVFDNLRSMRQGSLRFDQGEDKIERVFKSDKLLEFFGAGCQRNEEKYTLYRKRQAISTIE